MTDSLHTNPQTQQTYVMNLTLLKKTTKWGTWLYFRDQQQSCLLLEVKFLF
jgi:hypothetical protein